MFAQLAALFKTVLLFKISFIKHHRALITNLTPNAVDDQCFFIGAYRQGGGKAAHAVGLRSQRCFFKPHPIADFAPPASLFLFLHPLNRREPPVCVAFPCHQGNIIFFAVALHFKQPALIFLPRMNVGIVKIGGKLELFLQQSYHVRRARRTANMEQEFLREAEHRVQESGFRDLDAGCKQKPTGNW